MGDFDSDLTRYVSEVMPTYRIDLTELVRVPSISAKAENRDDLQRVLEMAGRFARLAGFKTNIVETPGNPILVGHLEVNPQAPWVTVYNHMDVQPADDDSWKSNPFEPVVTDDKIVGRGATDDKGPALSALYGIDFLNTHEQLPVNVQLIYETDEEMGSRDIGSFLDQSQILHRPDSILISDTIFEGDHPTITYKLRGIVMVNVELQLGEKEVHSGIFGGIVENPMNTLLNVLGTCMDYSSRPLFFDRGAERGTELTPNETDGIRNLADVIDLERIRVASGREALLTNDPQDAILRNQHMPTIEVHRIYGGVSPGKTSLPYKVGAEISMRLVPGQDPDETVQALERCLQKQDPRIKVTKSIGQPASIVADPSSPFVKAAAEACKYGFGEAPVYVGVGGSIGAVAQFQRVWPQVPQILLAQSLLTDGYHEPNEEFKFRQAERGIRAVAKYLASIGDLRTARA